ncbi:MAG: hypothetical protein K9J13_02570 [Saprospiraceae bacterium]|nr:hypothetical protein [Saprospiraceae bacterium]
MFLKLLLIALVLIAFAFLALGIKMFFKKGGEFKKTCSTMDATGKKVGCVCAGEDETKCEYFEEHHGKESIQISNVGSEKLSDFE